MPIKNKSRILWVFIAAPGLLGLVYVCSLKTMHIKTTPVPAIVWLDGRWAGETPCRITLWDWRQHQIKVTALDPDQQLAGLELEFLPVMYTFTRRSMPAEITIPLPPRGYTPPEIWRSGRHRLSADWQWVLADTPQGTMVVNLQSPDAIIPAEGMIDISPNGKFGLSDFEIAMPPPPGEDKFWLSPVDQSSESIQVFKELTEGKPRLGYISIGPQLGFSPDSKWLWFANRHQVAVASMEDPQNLVFLIDNNGANPFWAPTGNRFAVMIEKRRFVVYDLINGKWQQNSSTVFRGWPFSWSQDGSQLWVDQSDEWNSSIIKIDFNESRIVSQVDLTEQVIYSLSSPDGSLLAAIIRYPLYNDIDRVAVINSRGEVLILQESQHYGYFGPVLCWIDEHLIMVGAGRVYRIINIETDLVPDQP